MAFLIVLGALALAVLVFLAAAVKIVRPYQRGIVERLGKYKETVDPGLQLIVPFIDSMRIVDMREQVVDVPPQEVITKDNVVVAVDAVDRPAAPSTSMSTRLAPAAPSIANRSAPSRGMVSPGGRGLRRP